MEKMFMVLNFVSDSAQVGGNKISYLLQYSSSK